MYYICNGLYQFLFAIKNQLIIQNGIQHQWNVFLIIDLMMEKYFSYNNNYQKTPPTQRVNSGYSQPPLIMELKSNVNMETLNNINFRRKDHSQQKQESYNFYKKKQLRRDSSDNLALAQRVKSISSYNFFSTSNVQKEKRQLKLKQNRSYFQNFQNTDHNKTISNAQNSSRSQIKFKNQNNLKFTKTLGSNRQVLLNWGKSQKKKTRRNTGLIDYCKVEKLESTMDSKKEANTTISNENSMSQYFNNSLGQFNNKNSRKIQNSISKSNYMILNQNKYLTQELDHHKTKTLKKTDFQIGKKLGTGNFGQAYLVRHKQTKFICAMKIMKKQKIKSEKYENQIARQVSIQSYLRHPNLVQLYGVFEDYFNVYLLMEFCPDGQLYGMIKSKMRIQQQTTSQIIKGVSKGVDYLHRQMVIHRDLKPENIFLSFSVPKVGDFGWAVYMGKNGQLRRTSSGSPLYYSPQVVQKQEYDEKIDIWGIGTITYECIIGMVPFKVYSLMNLNRIVNDELSFPSYVEISQEAKDFIQKCLRKKPEQRISTQLVLRHQFIKISTQ